jgi:hypothetical protein
LTRRAVSGFTVQIGVSTFRVSPESIVLINRSPMIGKTSFTSDCHHHAACWAFLKVFLCSA